MDQEGSVAIEDFKIAPSLDNSSSRMVLATSDFLIRVSNLYREKAPFLAADCATKALTLNSQASTKNDLKPLSKMFEKLQKSVCCRCKTSLITGQNATLSWKSSAALLRRFGGEKRLRKIATRRDAGTAVTKNQNRLYARYLKKKAATNGLKPRLIIRCTTCGYVSSIPLIGSANQSSRSSPLGWQNRSRDDHSSLIGYENRSRDDSSSLIGQSIINASSEKKKKRKRRRKDPNAGLNLSGQEKANITAESKAIEKMEETAESSSATIMKQNLQRKTFTQTPLSSTPRPLMAASNSGGGQSKKKTKSRLEKLLAEEERKKQNRNSVSNASGLTSFLESL